MNPVHTLFVQSGGLRANVFVSNDKIPFLVLLHVGDYLARFVHAVQWILLGIHEFFGTRLKSDFSIINTLPRHTCRRDMALCIGTSKRFYFICLFIKSDVFQASELIQSEWAPFSWLASTFVQTTRPTGYFAGMSSHRLYWTYFYRWIKLTTLLRRLIIFSLSSFWKAYLSALTICQNCDAIPDQSSRYENSTTLLHKILATL